ncbi:copper chaperone PCu(A)C [Sphingobium sp.]|uniref:copper chaperone PCu(A)C n=1 Tax=Sphingobium sp. TaxID=1912891 RepID=UPI0029C0D2BF|nr:copper chaperone PCu(A)C [Sphingobium sp.]
MFGSLSVLAAPMLLAACADPAPLYVDQAWIRISPNKDTPSAGYFVVHGGEASVELRDVITDRALRVEMHESTSKDGKMTMQPIEAVPVPAKTQVAFAPGGKHLMLWGVNPEAVQQGKVPLTFLFSNGDRIIVDAIVQKTGAAAPAGAEHKQH